MKKLLILTFFSILFTFIKANVVTDLAKNTYDSTKIAVTNTVNSADTNSNFKMIYSDLKDGIGALAQSLKVGAEHVYIVIVKQQIVNSITNLVIYLFSIVLMFHLSSYFSKEWFKESWEEKYSPGGGSIFFIIFFCTLLIISLLFFTLTINKTVMGFVNPEYGAMKDIINFVQGVSNGTCNTCH